MAELKQIDIKELLNQLENKVLVDVRSPKEFEEFHIPGAISMPLFSNKEREIVGTLFKQKGQEEAKIKGLEFVSLKLPGLYQKICELKEQSKEIVIYCWRGGMRSKSLATFMTMMGVACFQLKGGIRSFRRLITEELAEFGSHQKRFIVIEGYTGSRKTDMLKHLEEEGYPVIDLEGLAGHRGSIFGSVGLNPQSQKSFECRLWMRLKELKDSTYYIIEGESKRIGRVVLPEFITKGKENGVGLLVFYPFDKRVEAILSEYNPSQNKEALSVAYEHLKRYLAPQILKELDASFLAEDWSSFVGLLLTDYYDPRYRHKHKEYEREAVPITVSSVEEGAMAIKEEINRLLAGKSPLTNASILLP